MPEVKPPVPTTSGLGSSQAAGAGPGHGPEAPLPLAVPSQWPCHPTCPKAPSARHLPSSIHVGGKAKTPRHCNHESAAE